MLLTSFADCLTVKQLTVYAEPFTVLVIATNRSTKEFLQISAIFVEKRDNRSEPGLASHLDNEFLSTE